MEPFGIILSSMVYSSLCVANYVVDMTLHNNTLPVRDVVPQPTFISLPLPTVVSSVYVGNDCPICLDTFVEGDEVIVLSCGHTYHPTCIETWSRTGNVCPLCRTSLR